MDHQSHSFKALAFGLCVLLLIPIGLFSADQSFTQQPSADTHVNQTKKLNQIEKFARNQEPKCPEIGDVSRLKLFVEGMDTGLRAVSCMDGAHPSASFWLRHERTTNISPEADQAVWTVILGHPLETIGQLRTRSYDIILPGEGNKPVQSLANPGAKFSYYIFTWWSMLAVAAVLLVWGLLIYLGWRSALLRDAAAQETALRQRTFSLAKTQLAWWFAIIYAAFIFLWLVTGEVPSLSGQALALLGISSVTTITSLAIASGRPSSPGTRGVFFRDVLSDANGIAIQRFQMLVMTVSLGLVFLFNVATRLTMPEFDASLLTLLGLSAGTYLGLKIPEEQDKEKTGAAAESATQDPKLGYAPTP